MTVPVGGKISREEEVVVLKASAADQIRMKLRDAAKVISNMTSVGVTDGALINQLPALQSSILEITAWVEVYKAYALEKDAGLK